MLSLSRRARGGLYVDRAAVRRRGAARLATGRAAESLASAGRIRLVGPAGRSARLRTARVGRRSSAWPWRRFGDRAAGAVHRRRMAAGGHSVTRSGGGAGVALSRHRRTQSDGTRRGGGGGAASGRFAAGARAGRPDRQPRYRRSRRRADQPGHGGIGVGKRLRRDFRRAVLVRAGVGAGRGAVPAGQHARCPMGLSDAALPGFRLGGGPAGRRAELGAGALDRAELRGGRARNRPWLGAVGGNRLRSGKAPTPAQSWRRARVRWAWRWADKPAITANGNSVPRWAKVWRPAPRISAGRWR